MSLTSTHDKVNLGVGVYYDENGKLPLLKCVAARPKRAMVQRPKRARLPAHRRHRRLRQSGADAWRSAPSRRRQGRATRRHRAGASGGTGALEVAADFLKRLRPRRASADQRPELGEPPCAVHASRLRGRDLSVL